MSPSRPHMVLLILLHCSPPFLFLSLFLHLYKFLGSLECYCLPICCLFPHNSLIHWPVSFEFGMLIHSCHSIPNTKDLWIFV